MSKFFNVFLCNGVSLCVYALKFDFVSGTSGVPYLVFFDDFDIMICQIQLNFVVKVSDFSDNVLYSSKF